MKPPEVLYNKSATKKELRQALAEALNLEWKEPEKDQTKNDFKNCLNYFLESYKNQTKLDYSFTTKDGYALTSIIKKIEKVTKTGDITATFQYMIKHLPSWYKENAFSLAIINSKFNEIIAMITQTKSKSNDNYKRRTINDLFR